jgi:hypothetical protein
MEGTVAGDATGVDGKIECILALSKTKLNAILVRQNIASREICL